MLQLQSLPCSRPCRTRPKAWRVISLATSGLTLSAARRAHRVLSLQAPHPSFSVIHPCSSALPLQPPRLTNPLHSRR